jgi:hypothetical protein
MGGAATLDAVEPVGRGAHEGIGPVVMPVRAWRSPVSPI